MSNEQLPIPKLSLSDPNLAQQILEACIETGFFYLTDHGIPSHDVDSMFETSSRLFLEETEQERLKYQDRINNTGYTSMRHEKLDSTSTAGGDLKESFYLARLAKTSGKPQPGDTARPDPHQPPSQLLPPSLEKLRQPIGEFVEECKRVCDAVLAGFALAIGHDVGFFHQSHHGQHDRLRLIHYPPTEVSTAQDISAGGSIRAGSHSDFGSCTLLFQKDVGGLQVQTKAGDWIDIPPQPNCLVVNVGDAIEFWTAGLFRSTQHRVVMPRTESETGSRFSMAYFCQPDEHTKLEPLTVPSSLTHKYKAAIMSRAEFHQRCTAKGVVSMTALTGGQHLRARLAASYPTKRTRS
ncbi:Clavaminate synthase-like protein [Testicularia cyperi]|uniref:Clavaminate synthase-like protein n=1 Tax=Testicularia cyperi TaxID=1882483 RepID=A0A317XVU9_9BASI|nr:Clavaminate synthase-like protein [Testicularia cyperi]